jgi:hypothetical protein
MNNNQQQQQQQQSREDESQQLLAGRVQAQTFMTDRQIIRNQIRELKVQIEQLNTEIRENVTIRHQNRNDQNNIELSQRINVIDQQRTDLINNLNVAQQLIDADNRLLFGNEYNRVIQNRQQIQGQRQGEGQQDIEQIVRNVVKAELIPVMTRLDEQLAIVGRIQEGNQLLIDMGQVLQDNLNDFRKEAIRDLRDLRRRFNDTANDCFNMRTLIDLLNCLFNVLRFLFSLFIQACILIARSYYHFREIIYQIPRRFEVIPYIGGFIRYGTTLFLFMFEIALYNGLGNICFMLMGFGNDISTILLYSFVESSLEITWQIGVIINELNPLKLMEIYPNMGNLFLSSNLGLWIKNLYYVIFKYFNGCFENFKLFIRNFLGEIIASQLEPLIGQNTTVGSFVSTASTAAETVTEFAGTTLNNTGILYDKAATFFGGILGRMPSFSLFSNNPNLTIEEMTANLTEVINLCNSTLSENITEHIGGNIHNPEPNHVYRNIKEDVINNEVKGESKDKVESEDKGNILKNTNINKLTEYIIGNELFNKEFIEKLEKDIRKINPNLTDELKDYEITFAKTQILSLIDTCTFSLLSFDFESIKNDIILFDKTTSDEIELSLNYDDKTEKLSKLFKLNLFKNNGEIGGRKRKRIYSSNKKTKKQKKQKNKKNKKIIPTTKKY